MSRHRRPRGPSRFSAWLKDLELEPDEFGVGSRTPYTGHWAIQGQNMVWRHDQGPSDGLDVNPMKLTDSDNFTLTEGSGSTTKYELIRRVPSAVCKP